MAKRQPPVLRGSNSETLIQVKGERHHVTLIGYGIKGERGAGGRDGTDGVDGSGDKSYVHNQPLPASVWTVVHALEKFPAVQVVDSTGALVDGDVRFIDMNTLELRFVAGFSGKAFLN